MSATVVDLAERRERRDGTEPWLTKQQMAAHLGFSVRWLEYRVAAGIPHDRFGGRVRFQRSAVELWLRGREGGGRDE